MATTTIKHIVNTNSISHTALGAHARGSDDQGPYDATEAIAKTGVSTAEELALMHTDALTARTTEGERALLVRVLARFGIEPNWV
jgi:hypothetical protein